MFLVIEKAGKGNTVHVEVHTKTPRRLVAVLTCLATPEGRAAIEYLASLDLVGSDVVRSELTVPRLQQAASLKVE